MSDILKKRAAKQGKIGNLERQPNETDAQWAARVEHWLSADSVRTKTDLKDWTGSYPFHLDR